MEPAEEGLREEGDRFRVGNVSEDGGGEKGIEERDPEAEECGTRIAPIASSAAAPERDGG